MGESVAMLLTAVSLEQRVGCVSDTLVRKRRLWSVAIGVRDGDTIRIDANARSLDCRSGGRRSGGVVAAAWGPAPGARARPL